MSEPERFRCKVCGLCGALGQPSYWGEGSMQETPNGPMHEACIIEYEDAKDEVLWRIRVLRALRNAPSQSQIEHAVRAGRRDDT